MKQLAYLAAATAAFVSAPTIARASSCHGGDNSGSHSYCPPDHRSVGQYGTAYTAAPCEDETDVVGYRQCKKYGEWGSRLAMPHLTIEAGLITRQFGTLLGGQTANVSHGGESFVLRAMGPQAQAHTVDTAMLTSLRASVDLSHGLYTALEVGLGGLAMSSTTGAEMASSGVFGTPELAQQRGYIVDSLATFGVRQAGRTGAIAAEVGGGVRAVSYRFHSDYHFCEDTATITAVSAIAEARVRGELWVTPWLTAGVTVGTSVLERGSWMGGAYLGLHSRAFGGSY